MPKTRTYLSKREHEFVMAYVECGEPLEAARRAGYKGKNEDILSRTGRGVLKKARIRAAIKQLRQEIAERESKILTLVQGKELLTRIFRGEETVPVMEDGEVRQRPFSDGVRLRAFEALAATMGWNKETEMRLKHSGKIDGEVKHAVALVKVPAKLTREEWDLLWGDKAEENQKEEKKT